MRRRSYLTNGPVGDPMPLELRDMQSRLRAAVLGSGDGALGALLRADENIAARVAVHRHTVRRSLVEVLAAAYPVSRRIVGEAIFAQLADRFVVAAPPSVPQLSAYGGAFAAFIAHADIGQRLPYLADVARLEWARAEAYFAADAPALDFARLAALPPEDIETTRLHLHPASRLVASAFPIQRIWQVNQPEVAAVPEIDLGVAETVIITRKDHHVATRAIAAGDRAFLTAIANGGTLGEAADSAVRIDAAFDLRHALRDHFIAGTFRDDAQQSLT